MGRGWEEGGKRSGKRRKKRKIEKERETYSRELTSDHGQYRSSPDHSDKKCKLQALEVA